MKYFSFVFYSHFMILDMIMVRNRFPWAAQPTLFWVSSCCGGVGWLLALEGKKLI
jgi:hypothetical protein